MTAPEKPLPHVERMLAELAELGGRLEKLGQFIDFNPMFRKLPVDEQVDLRLQREQMHGYHATLTRRIGRAWSQA